MWGHIRPHLIWRNTSLAEWMLVKSSMVYSQTIWLQFAWMCESYGCFRYFGNRHFFQFCIGLWGAQQSWVLFKSWQLQLLSAWNKTQIKRPLLGQLSIYPGWTSLFWSSCLHEVFLFTQAVILIIVNSFVHFNKAIHTKDFNLQELTVSCSQNVSHLQSLGRRRTQWFFSRAARLKLTHSAVTHIAVCLSLDLTIMALLLFTLAHMCSHISVLITDTFTDICLKLIRCNQSVS